MTTNDVCVCGPLILWPLTLPFSLGGPTGRFALPTQPPSPLTHRLGVLAAQEAESSLPPSRSCPPPSPHRHHQEAEVESSLPPSRMLAQQLAALTWDWTTGSLAPDLEVNS